MQLYVSTSALCIYACGTGPEFCGCTPIEIDRIFTVGHLATALEEKMEISPGSSSAGKWRMSPAINHRATLTDSLAL